VETNREKVAAPACAGNLAGAVCKRARQRDPARRFSFRCRPIRSAR